MRIRQRTFNIILIALAVAVLAAAGYLFFKHTRAGNAVPVAAVTAVPPDAQAAMAGVSAFYTIDYTETSDQWVQRVCQRIDSDQDCAVTKLLLAPQIYALAQKYKVQTTSTVFPVRLVSDRTGQDGSELCVWELQVTLSNPWPGLTSPLPVYADVVLNPTSRTWAMRHILFDQEAKALQTAAP